MSCAYQFRHWVCVSRVTVWQSCVPYCALPHIAYGLYMYYAPPSAIDVSGSYIFAFRFTYSASESFELFLRCQAVFTPHT